MANALYDPYKQQQRSTPSVDSAVLELLGTDQFFDHAKGYHNADAAILSELSATDAQIDATKKASKVKAVGSGDEGKVLAELCNMDRLVDVTKQTSKVNATDLHDCYHQEKRSGTITCPGKDAYQTNASTMMDLISTDEFVDGMRNEKDQVDAKAHQLHLDLLSVDSEVACATSACGAPGSSVLRALHEMDNEIDNAARTVATTATGTPCTSTVNSSERSQLSSAIEAELAAAGLTGVLADLYVMDRRIDGADRASRTRDDVAAILELYNVDVTVDNFKAKQKNLASSGGVCDDILVDLWTVDRMVEKSRGVTQDAEDAHFIDPHEAAAMRQVQLFAARDLHDEIRIHDVVDLLRNDILIDGKRHHDIDMEGVESLLAIDQSIDGNKAQRCKHHDVSDVLSLLEVDRAIDRHKSKTAKKHVDPWEAMLAMDRLVDGAADEKSQERIDGLISELRRNDQSVDSLFTPDIFDDLMGGANESANSLTDLPPPTTLDGDGDEDGAMKYEIEVRDSIQDLFEVDQSASAGKKKSKYELDSDVAAMHIMLDLFKLDVEVDRARKNGAFQASNTLPSATPNSPIKSPTHNPGEKRSIFSTEEKKSSENTHCVARSLMVGTTTVVNNRKRIGSIPLGEVVASELHSEFFGDPDMTPVDPYGATAELTDPKSKKHEQCAVM